MLFSMFVTCVKAALKVVLYQLLGSEKPNLGPVGRLFELLEITSLFSL
jgi:hypothetical protein